MTKSPLSQGLRNYLIQNSLTHFIDLEKSVIEEKAEYQILVLRKPNSIISEIESAPWNFSASKGLLIYNCNTGKVTFISLEFEFKLPGVEKEIEFTFSRRFSFKQINDQIMVISTGNTLESDMGSVCTDVALFNTDGNLISVWKVDGSNDYQTSISDFCKVKEGLWLVKFKTSREHPYVYGKKLFLLSLGQYKEFRLLREREDVLDTGLILGSKTSEMRTWFSEENDKGLPNFFVLAYGNQFCMYRYGEYGYERIADVLTEKSYICNLEVTRTDEFITVKTLDKKSWVKYGSFSFYFNKEGS